MRSTIKPNQSNTPVSYTRDRTQCGAPGVNRVGLAPVGVPSAADIIGRRDHVIAPSQGPSARSGPALAPRGPVLLAGAFAALRHPLFCMFGHLGGVLGRVALHKRQLVL